MKKVAIFDVDGTVFRSSLLIELVNEFKLIKYIRLTEKSTGKTEGKVCPKCGGKLEEKIGKYGKFLGCSKYPKCQYAENIKK